jgi:protein-tyrosine-phosphatase
MTHLVGFENLVEGVVIGSQNKQGVTICRVAETSIEIQLPQVSVPPGSPIHVGIKADEILLALSRPTILGTCNLIQGSVKQLDDMGTKVEARIDAGVEFRVHLPARPPEFMNLKRGDNVWMMIRPQSCHLIRSRRMRATQRLFVFICNRNTSRSPMAAAICNAEIARRLKISPEALKSVGVHAVSAGLAAREGDFMAAEAQQALNHLHVPVPAHRAQNLTAELAAKAEFIFCMTESQRQAVLNMFPQFESKTLCLHPTVQIEAPHLEGEEEFLRLAQQVQEIMPPLVDRLLTPVEVSESA